MKRRVLLLCFVVLLSVQCVAAWDAPGFDYRITYTVNKSMVNGSHSQMPIGFQLNVSGLDVNTSVVQVYLPNGTRLAVEKEHYTDPYGLYWIGALDINDTVDYEFVVYYDNSTGVEPAADSTYGSQAVWNNNYKAVWHMNTDPNGDAANSIKDSTPNLNHGTPAGAMVSADLVDSDYGKKINFVDGQYITIPDDPTLEFSSFDFSLEIWISTSTTATDHIFSRYNGWTANEDWIMYLNSPVADDVTFQTSVSAGVYNTNSDHSVNINDGNEHYIAITKITGAGGQKMYTDGTYRNAANSIATFVDGSNPVVLAGMVGSGTYAGDIIEARMIVGSAHSANYITTTHNNFNNPTATGTAPFYYSISVPDYNFLYPDINTSLTSPINNSYTHSNNLTFNIAGNFSTANATIFVDSTDCWNGSISLGSNSVQISPLSDGLHSWYVNATASASGNTTYNLSSSENFTYDISDPTVSTVDIDPDYATISDGTIVKINISWSDNLQLKNGTFYVDTGSGFSETDNTTLSGVSDWFNTSINTTGQVGNIVTWKQDVYDQAGNNHSYSDSFYVALPSLLIYVFDETTAAPILPSDVTVYNENASRSATINASTNISTLDYGNFSTGKYIVRVIADDYYTRRSIALIDIETVSSLNVFLPSSNETVIFDQFVLADHTLEYTLSDCIIRLDKPLPNGTDTVFSSYFDFDGVSSTYLIATDQYILYIVTPDSVVNYGWLTPDADGQIDIIIINPITDLLDDWLGYSLLKDDTGSISLVYESDISIDTCYFYINASNGSGIYSASSGADSGSFTYVADVNSSYWVHFLALSDSGFTKEINRLVFWNEGGVQPERLPLLPDGAPDWFYNLLSIGIIIISVLLFSQIRADVSCIVGASLTCLFWYWGGLKIPSIIVAVCALIAIAAVMARSRREGGM